jgi:hypothetical protein
MLQGLHYSCHNIFTLRHFFLFVLAFGSLLMASTNGFSQAGKYVTVKGYVIASEDASALTGVHIYARGANTGTVTRGEGLFSIVALANDTLVFSSVGYSAEHIALSGYDSKTIEMLVRLKPEIRELPGLTIQDSPLLDYMMRSDFDRMRLPWRHPPPQRDDIDVPIGSTSYGPISFLSKEAKEKRRLLKKYKVEQQEKVYTTTVNDDSLRAAFMERYAISRREFDDFIIHFNRSPIPMNTQDPKSIAAAMHREYLKYKSRIED